MKLLAIDTATEQCSAALVADRTWSRVIPTARGHADAILPMIDELFAESGLALRDLDGLAFGRGPGSFTGVRIAVSVIQGLALAAQLPVVGISNLATVAQQVCNAESIPIGSRVLVCMDARMHEVYWSVYRVAESGVVELVGEERVSAPADVQVDTAEIAFAVGTGWAAYPELGQRLSIGTPKALLPRALEIAQLGAIELRAGRGVPAARAQPIYLRDNVVAVARDPTS